MWKRKADIEFACAVKSKKHVRISHTVLGADAQERRDIVEVDRFGFFGSPTAVVLEITTGWVNDQALEGFGCTRHRFNLKAGPDYWLVRETLTRKYGL